MIEFLFLPLMTKSNVEFQAEFSTKVVFKFENGAGFRIHHHLPANLLIFIAFKLFDEEAVESCSITADVTINSIYLANLRLISNGLRATCGPTFR